MFRYADDVLSKIYNSKFGGFVDRIYSIGVEIKDTRNTTRSAHTPPNPIWPLCSVVFLLAATLYQGNLDRNHKLWNIILSERYILHMQDTSRYFPHSRLIIGVVTRLTRRVPLVEQELPALPERLSSPPVFSGVRVTRSLVLCVCLFGLDRFHCTWLWFSYFYFYLWPTFSTIFLSLAYMFNYIFIFIFDLHFQLYFYFYLWPTCSTIFFRQQH
jgi:hypothetical protein